MGYQTSNKETKTRGLNISLLGHLRCMDTQITYRFMTGKLHAVSDVLTVLCGEARKSFFPNKSTIKALQLQCYSQLACHSYIL
jgi:hypothetical protein